MKFAASNVPRLDMRIPHRNWTKAINEAFALLLMALPGEVICITGPSRAGKSCLISELSRQLVGDGDFTVTGKMPVVTVEAVNAGPNGTFSTKAFIHRMLESVKHPIFGVGESDGYDHLGTLKLERATESTLRLALERAFKYRGTKYLFIDEAQHAQYASKNSQAPCAVMDSWKCLAQTAGLVLIVVGAYPILKILRNSPHLLGRKRQVHLPRYHSSNEDLREFAKIVQVYQKALLPLLGGNSLLEHTKFLHRGSWGCIGLLRAWLSHAATLASLREVCIDIELLEHAVLSDSDLSEISHEITEGEYLLQSSAEKLGAISEHQLSDGVDSAKGPKKKGASKPFQRKPKRNLIGNRSEGAKS
ncbi:MAG: hypothetical protein CL583_10505 [Alteromonadaceae bacterium]|nr:hypothetical protein [Alteromonadaceae bacterium]|tara:strand:- start:5943 stop:7025 length:1083 start_codon:yes stop_codon:yes gene_type:complete